MNNEIDLLAELQQATELKPEPISAGTRVTAVTTPDEHTVQPSTDSEPGAEPLAQSFEDDFAPPAPDAITPGDAVTSLTYAPDKLADLIIDGVDTLMEHVLPMAFIASLSKADRHALSRLAHKYKQNPTAKTLTLDDDDLSIMPLLTEIENYKEMCPLDADEKKSLKAPLVEVLAAANYRTTPTNALLISASFIALPRLLPLLIKK